MFICLCLSITVYCIVDPASAVVALVPIKAITTLCKYTKVECVLQVLVGCLKQKNYLFAHKWAGIMGF